MAKLSALIVDDEQLARDRIRTLLEDDSDIEILGECADGQGALKAIREQVPAMVFLDIQIPEMDGFGVLQGIESEAMPAIVFTTAYDQYALQAFEAHAIDYLLKPFDRERFERAVQRAKAQARSSLNDKLNRKLMALLENFKAEPKWLERLVVKSDGRIVILRTKEVDWIEGSGNYLRLHMGAQSYLLRETMTNIESKLDPARFVRTHRSTIVNIDSIKELQPWFRGDHMIVLRDGSRVALSRSHRDKFESVLGRPL